MSVHLTDTQGLLDALKWYEALAGKAFDAFMQDDDKRLLGTAMRLAADGGDRGMTAKRRRYDCA